MTSSHESDYIVKKMTTSYSQKKQTIEIDIRHLKDITCLFC